MILNYNFNLEDVKDMDFKAIYEVRRRDSCFAYVFEKESYIFALRDHLGIVPLFFRFYENGDIKFSTQLTPLMDSTLNISVEGFKYFLAFGTSRIISPFEGIYIVPPGTVIKIDRKSKIINSIYTYKLKKSNVGSKFTMEDYVAELDALLMRAIDRTCKYDKVGLYLSGGIDSAITGMYLKRLGVKVNAYTSAPWGKQSSEIHFTKKNAETIGVENHYMDILEVQSMKDAMHSIIDIYGMPHGTTTGIGVSSLWKTTPISEEKQIYGAQGSDTINLAVPAQYRIFVCSYLPKFIQHTLHRNLKYADVLENYLSFCSNAIIKDCSLLRQFLPTNSNRIFTLTLGGIYVVHIPSDGEVLSGPVFRVGALYANPFYDVDLVEFVLGIPLKYRIAFSRHEKTKIYLDKIVLRRLAQKYLCKEVINRKKGFVVPFYKSNDVMELLNSIPAKVWDIPIETNEQKFSCYLFSQYCLMNGIFVQWQK